MRNGLVWNRCCPTRSRVAVAGGRITARCLTGCSGGPVVVSRGGMCRLRSEAGRPSTTGIAAGQVMAPWLGSWTSCALRPMWPTARTGRSGWTARWSALISTPPVPATSRPPTFPRRSSRRPSWTQGGGSNDKKSGDESSDEPDPAGGQSAGRSGKPSREAIGRSRGGLTSKIHLAADRRCRPISRVTSAGQRHDSLGLQPVMAAIRIRRRGPGRPRTRPGRVLGDKAYSSRAIRTYLRKRRIKATIPEPADQKKNRLRRGSTADVPHFSQASEVSAPRCTNARPASVGPRSVTRAAGTPAVVSAVHRDGRRVANQNWAPTVDR